MIKMLWRIYRVLDFTQFVSGPACSRIAELGAEVIKLELAPNGDHARVQVCRREVGTMNNIPKALILLNIITPRKVLRLILKSKVNSLFKDFT